MDLTDAKKALDKAKVHIMAQKDSTFITTICLSLIHEFSDEFPIAATNGKRVKYNPVYFMQLSPEQRIGLVLHETWHVVFDHMGRQGDRDHKKYNRAGDYVINNMLDNRKIKLPPGGLINHDYDDMHTDQIYDLLSDDPDFEGDLLVPDGDIKEHKATMDDLVIQASIKAQMAGDSPGSIPGNIQIRIKELTTTKLRWDRILAKFFNSQVKSDFTFRRPNRRYLPDYILPSAHSEALGNVAMAIDMSGSVTDEETTQFISDVYQVLHTLSLRELNLVQFDTQVFQVDKIETVNELLSIDFCGRGGTNIDPVMQWGLDDKPDVLVVFTDGCFDPPEVNPKVPVIWVIYGDPDFTAPFGKVIHYEV